jgi:microcystin-dependent protein
MLFVPILLLAGFLSITGNPDSMGTIPIGTIFIYGGDLVPSGWLLCNGQELSRLTYPSLFYTIGTLYGSGDHVRTFNVPDFRGRFPLGADPQRGQTSGIHQGGASSITLTQAELPPHAHGPGSLKTYAAGEHVHNLRDPGHDHGGRTGENSFGSGGNHGLKVGGNFLDVLNHTHSIPPGLTKISIQTAGAHTHSLDGQTASQGNGRAFSIMPPYQAINYIIYAGPNFTLPTIGK